MESRPPWCEENFWYWMRLHGHGPGRRCQLIRRTSRSYAPQTLPASAATNVQSEPKVHNLKPNLTLLIHDRNICQNRIFSGSLTERTVHNSAREHNDAFGSRACMRSVSGAEKRSGAGRKFRWAVNGSRKKTKKMRSYTRYSGKQTNKKLNY